MCVFLITSPVLQCCSVSDLCISVCKWCRLSGKSVLKFLLGTKVGSKSKYFGILMIVASIYVTAGAILLGVPIALFTSVLWHVTARRNLQTIEIRELNWWQVYLLLYMVFWPDSLLFLWSDRFSAEQEQYAGSLCSWNDDLPTIMELRNHCDPQRTWSYYEGVHWHWGQPGEESIFLSCFRQQNQVFWQAVVLGIGRAIGETMAVVMVAGNQPRMPQGNPEGIRTMTANIVTEMGYATGLHREALIATAVVLFIFILIINLSLSLLNRRARTCKLKHQQKLTGQKKKAEWFFFFRSELHILSIRIRCSCIAYPFRCSPDICCYCSFWSDIFL